MAGISLSSGVEKIFSEVMKLLGVSFPPTKPQPSNTPYSRNIKPRAPLDGNDYFDNVIGAWHNGNLCYKMILQGTILNSSITTDKIINIKTGQPPILPPPQTIDFGGQLFQPGPIVDLCIGRVTSDLGGNENENYIDGDGGYYDMVLFSSEQHVKNDYYANLTFSFHSKNDVVGERESLYGAEDGRVCIGIFPHFDCSFDMDRVMCDMTPCGLRAHNNVDCNYEHTELTPATTHNKLFQIPKVKLPVDFSKMDGATARLYYHEFIVDPKNPLIQIPIYLEKDIILNTGMGELKFENVEYPFDSESPLGYDVTNGQKFFDDTAIFDIVWFDELDSSVYFMDKIEILESVKFEVI